MSTPVTMQNRIYLLREEVQQLQGRLKAMYAGDLSPESRLSGYKFVTNKQKEQNEQLRTDIERMAKQIDEQNKENKRLKKALGRVDMIEKGCKSRGVGYDIEVHRIVDQALKEGE